MQTDAVSFELAPAPDAAAGPVQDFEREAFFREVDVFPAPADVDDPVGVDTALDHYLQLLFDREQEMQRNREIAERRHAMIEAWEQDVNGSLKRECRWLKLEIEALAAGYDFGTKRSRALPHGSFGYRRGADRIEIAEPARAIAWAEGNGLESEVKKSIGKTPLLKHLKATGELPDGCEFIEGSDAFFIKSGS